jgi:hypothetical protein
LNSKSFLRRAGDVEFPQKSEPGFNQRFPSFRKLIAEWQSIAHWQWKVGKNPKCPQQGKLRGNLAA